MRAAIALVGERGTSNIPVSDIADAADVSRPLLYQHFGDRDTLLLEAALDLAQTDLVERAHSTDETLTERDRVLAAVSHFARHRDFYRAMLTGPCGYALTKALTDLLSPFNRAWARWMTPGDPAPELLDDLALFLTGGSAAVINTWVIEGPDPLDSEAFTDRLLRMLPVVTRRPSDRESRP
jgi:AcrR family transcriptional regulator